MDKPIQSEALEINLEETRKIKVHVPKPYGEFIDLSASHFGIHERALKCMTEYHHPYANHAFVVAELRKIVLNDFWFYAELEKSDEAFQVIVESLGGLLLSSGVDEKLKETIVRTLVEFIDRLADFPKKHKKIVDACMTLLEETIEKNRDIYMCCSAFFKKHLRKSAHINDFKDKIYSLAKEVLEVNINFWQETTKIEQWYRENESIFHRDYTTVIGQMGSGYFSDLQHKLNGSDTFDALVENVPSYGDIANNFRQLSDEFDKFIEKFYYTFYLLYLPGMSGLKDRLIRDINFLLASVVGEIDLSEIFGFLDKIFDMFSVFRRDHISPILNCIATLGKKIIDIDDSEDKFRVNYFEKKLIDFGFEFPGIVYVDKDWKTHVNENHLKNIRVWLDILKYGSAIPEKLLSALIVNLRLGGVYISDTDLFQRDITHILNSNISPFYKKVKQLSYIFPVYFNEIGAEGEIRQVTTSMDELSHRNDRLIHFLRKQVHIEGNNTLIEMARKIFYFWYDADLQTLKRGFPTDVYDSIDLKGRWFEPIHTLLKTLCDKQDCGPEKFLNMEQAELEQVLVSVREPNDIDRKRLLYLCRLYALLREKYSFDTVNIVSILERYSFLENGDISDFKSCMAEKDHSGALKKVFLLMGNLKQIILDPEPSEAWESIYYKRHVAFGIPSMYGVYRETKFEAMGLIFRLEKVAANLMDKIIAHINLNYISATTLDRIYKVLEFFKEGMALDGISNEGFNSNLQMLRYSLTSSTFSLGQYTNIFEFMAERIREIINEYFIRSYEYPLNAIVPQLFMKESGLSSEEKNRILLQKTEEFNREMISNCFLLQKFDGFIAGILKTLHNMVDNFSPDIINSIMRYNPDLIVTPFNEKSPQMDNKVFVGEKGYFLKKLYEAGIPVPPAFVLTTEVFRERSAIYTHPQLKAELNKKIGSQINELERLCGREFGNPQNPLLLSVRSGAAVSMPGAMVTFVNVGMNDEIATHLSREPGFGWAAWDSYRRLLQNWGMAHDIRRDVFDKVISDYKKKYRMKYKTGLSAEQMKELAFAYKDVLETHHKEFEQDPIRQLEKTISIVFDSWSYEQAKVYREYLKVSEDWGTSVIVQQMVFGNRNQMSGSGVVFTHNPTRGRPGVHLFGDFNLSSQGEDIVAGLVHSLPVGKTQRKQLKLEGTSLQEAFPGIYKKIHSLARELLGNLGFSHQEIEFTFESEKPEDLYILQVRNQNIRCETHVKVFEPRMEDMMLVGRGIGIGGGALSGILAFGDDDLALFAEKYPEKKTILVRPDTVPDDIGMIFKCDGLLTARGGITSHAAVTATKIGKICIVNCADLFVNEDRKECSIGGNKFKVGDDISIDGHRGNIYRGSYPIKTTEIALDTRNKYSSDACEGGF
jgi:pyruvate, orthophosphate dikinase